jgi:hypothetical protein
LAAAVGAGIYVMLGALCAVGWKQSLRKSRNMVWFWGSLAGLQFFLACDALFGVRLVLAEIGREFFEREDWYQHRVPVQLAASIVGVTLAAWAIPGAKRLMRHLPRGCWLALAGTCVGIVLFCLAVISMHLIEDLMDWPIQALSLGRILRLFGCALTLAGTWTYLCRSSPGDK